MYTVTLYQLDGKLADEQKFESVHEMHGWLRCNRRDSDNRQETYIFPSHRVHCVRVEGRPHFAAEEDR